jgi:DNA repair protein RecN (Recombination protein N)
MRYTVDAAKLSAARKKAAEKLDKAVNGELKPLKLERAKFSTQIESDTATAGPNGIDRVEFWVQTNPGTRPGPMMKVASGGELARFLLALKVVLADRGSAPTLVFDEIDTGVGGAVADAIGVRLARLGDRVQVVTVTHAPQVAAAPSGIISSPRTRWRRASGWRLASPSSKPRAAAKRSPGCWPEPRSPPRRAPPPRSSFARRPVRA